MLCDVTGATILKLEILFCALHHDQTQKLASRATRTSNSLELNPDHVSSMWNITGGFSQSFKLYYVLLVKCITVKPVFLQLSKLHLIHVSMYSISY